MSGFVAEQRNDIICLLAGDHPASTRRPSNACTSANGPVQPEEAPLQVLLRWVPRIRSSYPPSLVSKFVTTPSDWQSKVRGSPAWLLRWLDLRPRSVLLGSLSGPTQRLHHCRYGDGAGAIHIQVVWRSGQRMMPRPVLPRTRSGAMSAIAVRSRMALSLANGPGSRREFGALRCVHRDRASRSARDYPPDA